MQQETVTIRDGETTKQLRLGSPEAFQVLSQVWLRAGWDTKYVYTFSWLGRPIIQLPEDMVRIQEVIYQIKPDVIIETGVAHGGSLVFYAGICKVMGRGRIIGIDIEIRPHNRAALEQHELFPLITLVEGSSIAPDVVASVTELVKPGETVLILLDSNHSKEHVLAELRAYSPLVTPGSYIVATDGIMKDLAGAPRSKPDWAENNPYAAAQEFLQENPAFRYEQPVWPFNESNGLTDNMTYWPGSWLRRVAPETR
ncbi:MAG: cephalosporin hydroxylase family protein [Blastocatellia bacterium]|nr:cephalosporin hydroxylase family protein [Blastocatellia bacterium]